MTRLRKRLLKAAIAVLVALALYPVAANIFLSTPLFDMAVNQNKEDGWVQFEKAWSIWPGRVHVKKLWLRARDSNMEFHLQVDEAAFDMSFLALFKAQSIHMSDIDARGVSFRLRQRIYGPEGVPEIVDALPPIPGCERIPFNPTDPVDHRDKYDDAFYKLWTVDLSNVVARDVREIWIDSVRYQGIDELRGGFYFKPLRRMLVGPIDIDARAGSVSMMQHVVATDIVGKARITIDEIDPREGQEEGKMVHSLSVDVDGHVRVPDLAEIPARFVKKGLLKGPVETSRAAFHIDHGLFTEGSRIEVSAPTLEVNEAGHRWLGAVNAAIAIVKDPGDPNARFDIHADARDLSARSTTRQRAHVITAKGGKVDVGAHGVDLHELVTDLHVNASLDALDLRVGKADAGAIGRVLLDARVPEIKPKTAKAVQPPMRAEIDFTIGGGKVRDGMALAQLIDPDAEIRIDESRGGRFDAHAHAVAQGSVVVGNATAQLRGLGIATPTISVTGDADLRADIARLDVDRKRLSLKPSTVKATNVELKQGRASQPLATLAHLDLDGAAKDLDLGAPSLAGVDLHVVVTEAKLPDLRRVNGLLSADAKQVFESGAARADADVRLSSTERKGSGKITFALTDAAVRMEKMRMLGAADVAVDIRSYDPNTGAIDLSGSKITMHDVSVRGASAETTYWKGYVDLVGGQLKTRGGARFEGTAQLHADDAAPILALAMGDDLPGFLVGSLRAEGLSGQTKIELGGGNVAITSLHVRGGTLDVHGDYVKHGEDVRAAFIIEKGPLSAGLKIDQNGTFVRLFDLDRWLRAEKRVVEAEKAKIQADAIAAAQKAAAEDAEAEKAKAKTTPKK